MLLIELFVMTLGERIKTARKEKKLSQQELGDLVGVGKSSVCQWESGLTKNMDGVNLVKTAVALGLNPVWLATEKGNKHLFTSVDPIQSGINAVMQGVKAAIDNSGATLSDDSIKQIYKRVIDYYLDGTEINESSIKAIIELSLPK